MTLASTPKSPLASDSLMDVAAARAYAQGDSDIDRDRVTAVAERGWFSALAPNDAATPNFVAACQLAESLGSVLETGPLVPSTVIAASISRCGLGEESELAADIASGKALVTWSLAELDGSWQPTAGIEIHQNPTGETLFGTKVLVPDLAVSTHLAITVDDGDDGECSQLLVPLDHPQVVVEPVSSLDLTRRFAEVRLEAVPLADAVFIGGRGSMAAEVTWQYRCAMLLSMSESLGSMGVLFARANDYAKSRVAFGRPIGSFQAIKHLLADTSVILESSRALTRAAATAMSNQAAQSNQAIQSAPDDTDEIFSIAKSYIGDNAPVLANACWQTFGGIAYTWADDFHLFMRRLNSDPVAYGDPVFHRERICQLHLLGVSV